MKGAGSLGGGSSRVSGLNGLNLSIKYLRIRHFDLAANAAVACSHRREPVVERKEVSKPRMR
jgi:hypothetical protein